MGGKVVYLACIEPRPWNLQTKRGLIPLRCGATAGYWEYHGQRERQTHGFLRSCEPNKHYGLISLQESSPTLAISPETNACKKTIMQGMVEGKRKRGRPPASWLDDIKLITGKTITVATRATADRRRWSFIIRPTPALIYATWPEEEVSPISCISEKRQFIFTIIYFNTFLKTIIKL